MTVPATICELEKIETFRWNEQTYKLGHIVTKPHEIIQSSFGLEVDNISNSAEEISKLLTASPSLMNRGNLTMARKKSPETIDAEISKINTDMFILQDRYYKIVEKLKDLQERHRRCEANAIMDTYLKSGKSLEEISTFMKP